MLFRRSSRKSLNKACRRETDPVGVAARVAARSMIEALENRMMLTTLSGGGTGQTRTYEFVDQANNVFRIAMYGDITAEFIGVQMPALDATSMQIRPSAPRVVDLRPPLPANATVPPNYGVDLYSIYVSHSDADASISIAQVPPPGTTGAFRPMMPFTGSAGSFTVTNATDGEFLTVSPSANTGALILGTRTQDTDPNSDNEQGVAQLSVSLNRQFGVRPKSAKGKLDAGLTVAAGQNLGQFLFGGTVTGTVSIGASIDLFYAGELWTGDATGQLNNSAANRPRNFTVAGDLRNLVTSGSIGTDTIPSGADATRPDFETGVDIRVNGRLGSVVSKTDYLAALGVTHAAKARGPGTDQHEIEVRDVGKMRSESFFEGDTRSDDPRKAAPSLGDSALFNNDTQATAQYLGSAFASNVGKGTDDVIHLVGELNDTPQVNDAIDYYAVSLIAGQTIQIKTTSGNAAIGGASLPGLIVTGLIDPEGRVVASDISNQSLRQSVERPFRFTAKEPGVYRVAIAHRADTNFDGQVDDAEFAGNVQRVEYSLDISRIADTALGAIVASGTIAFDDPNLSVDVANGDIGAIVSAELGNNDNAIYASFVATGTPPITVRAGNLRAMQAASIGHIINGGVADGPDLRVPKGIVGMLRGTGPNEDTQTVAVNLHYVDNGAFVNSANAVGLDYQLIDAAGGFDSNLIADRGIGVIRAASTGTVGFAARLAANADSRGDDGFIDEIDIRGHIGTITAGGPQISTGPGGNVRYFHAGDATQVFRDLFFGGGDNDFINIGAGRSYNFVDDSGTSVKLTPLPLPTSTTTGTTTASTTGLRLVTYGIRGSGGSALIDVTTVPGLGTEASGLQVDTLSNGGAGSIEIGTIRIGTAGAPVTFNAAARSFTTAAAAAATVILKGRRTVDVFDLVGNNLNSVANNTDGEIVNVEAASVGSLTATTLGVGRSKTGTEIQSVDIKTEDEPFNANRSLINITGSAQSILARKYLGNINVGGTLGTLSANSDKVNDRKIYEGIVAPILTGGNLLNVNIGEGLASSGGGTFAQGGLFSHGVIVSVTNQGEGSDIRGDIVSDSGTTLPAVVTTDVRGTVTRTLPAVRGIGAITLSNGAIIDSDILVADFADALETHQTTIRLVNADLDNNANNINQISLSGNGGIIGATIGGANVGEIEVNGGFGVIDSAFRFVAATKFEGIDTDGYGIRSSDFTGGNTVDHINVRGTGKVLDTRSYTASVRQSESSGFDAFTGRAIAIYNDLHTFLGTSKAKPKNTFRSIAGTIDDTLFTGAQTLNTLSAWAMRGSDQTTDIPTLQFAFAQNVNSFHVTSYADGLNFTTGTVGNMSIGNLANALITVSGLFQSLSASNIKASSTIRITGSEGRLQSLVTKRAMFGNLNVATKIDLIHIGTDLGSTTLSSSNDIGTVLIDGSILNGATLRAADEIASLNIGKNIESGGTVRARRISAQNIKGIVRGRIVTG